MPASFVKGSAFHPQHPHHFPACFNHQPSSDGVGMRRYIATIQPSPFSESRV
jgi:hypothetical protein